MSTTINILDLIFLIFASIFVVTAFFRGFVKEIFSAFNWVLAIILSHIITPYIVDMIDGSKMLADMIIRTVVFVVILITLSMSTSSLCKDLKQKMPFIFDRSLGILFAIVKTLVIFGVCYSLFIKSYGLILGKPLEESSSRFPNFLKQAKCHDIIKLSASVLDPATQKFIDAISNNFDKMVPENKGYKKENNKLDGKINEIIDSEGEVDNKIPSDLFKQMPDAGYSKKDIEKMNRLIEIIE